MSRQIVPDGNRRPDNAVGLGVAAAFIAARFETAAHLVGYDVNDSIQALFLVRVSFLLGQLQPLIPALAVDQILDNCTSI